MLFIFHHQLTKSKERKEKKLRTYMKPNPEALLIDENPGSP